MGIKAQYTVKTGDRITRIAKNYQVTTQAIIDANPNIFTPGRLASTDSLIAAGTMNAGEVLIYAREILNIPDGEVDKMAGLLAVKADAQDELTILIDKKKCPNPHEFEFIEYFDSCSDSFSLVYPHDAKLKNPIMKVDPNSFSEKGLPQVQFFIGDEIALTGVVTVPAFKLSLNACAQTLAGRSATYLLEKSDMLSSLKSEYLNMNLKQICEQIAKAFGLSVTVQADIKIGDIFKKAVCGDSEKPFAFMARLARERGLLIGKTTEGNVYIFKAKSEKPVAFFNIDDEFLKFLGVDNLEFVFSTEEIFGSYIGKATTPDETSVSATVKSAVLLEQSVKIIEFQDGVTGNIQEMTAWEEQKTIREFYQNTIPYPSWLNPETGKRWKAGQFVGLISSETMISECIIMMIRSIVFKDSDSKKTCTLSLVPERTYINAPLVIENKKKSEKQSIIDRIGLRS